MPIDSDLDLNIQVLGPAPRKRELPYAELFCQNMGICVSTHRNRVRWVGARCAATKRKLKGRFFDWANFFIVGGLYSVTALRENEQERVTVYTKANDDWDVYWLRPRARS